MGKATGEAVEVLVALANVAEHGREGRKPPRAHSYLLVVDHREHTVHQHAMTATAILDLVEKSPDQWFLDLLTPGGERVPCAPDDLVVFHERRLVGFETRRRDHGHHHHHDPHPEPVPSPPVPVPPPAPDPAPSEPDRFAVEVVVNGEIVRPVVTPDTLLSDVVAQSLLLARTVGRPNANWELRLNGNLLSQNLTIEAAHVPSGAKLYLSLEVGAAGEGSVLVDPVVSRKKFAAEVANYRKIEKDMIARGQWVLQAEWPTVFAVFAAPMRGQPAIVPFGVVIDFENYDHVPPSVRMADPFTRKPYKGSELPPIASLSRLVKVGETAEGVPSYGIQPLVQCQQLTDLPFMCLPGVREYHEHPAHTGDAWLARRGCGEGTLFHLLNAIYLNGTKNVIGMQAVVAYEVPSR